MNKFDELIHKHCPNGVESKALEQILTIKNGRDYKQFGDGNIPVYGSGGIMTYIDTAAFDKPSVLIPRKGSLNKKRTKYAKERNSEHAVLYNDRSLENQAAAAHLLLINSTILYIKAHSLLKNNTILLLLRTWKGGTS